MAILLTQPRFVQPCDRLYNHLTAELCYVISVDHAAGTMLVCLDRGGLCEHARPDALSAWTAPLDGKWRFVD